MARTIPASEEEGLSGFLRDMVIYRRKGRIEKEGEREWDRHLRLLNRVLLVAA